MPNELGQVKTIEQPPKPPCPYAKLAAAIFKTAIDDFRGLHRGDATPFEIIEEFQSAAKLLYPENEDQRAHRDILLAQLTECPQQWLDIIGDNRAIWARQRRGRVRSAAAR